MARSIAAATSGSSRNRGVLMLAALFGVLSAGLMFAFLSTRGGDDSLDQALIADQGAESVVVVTRDIGVGEKIEAHMLTTRPVAGSALLTGRVTKMEDIVGKVATAPLYSGEQVINAKVTAYDGQATLAYKIPEGQRALGLEVPHEAWIVGGLVQPGDRVDVLGLLVMTVIDPLTGQERPSVISGYIAQDVEVLAVAQTLVKIVPKTDGTDDNKAIAGSRAIVPLKPGEEPGSYEKSISVTLALTPELAAKVALIDSMKDDIGQYRIVPRQRGDTALITGDVSWSLEEVFDIGR